MIFLKIIFDKNDVYDYSEYEERVIEVMVARRISNISFVKKMNIEHSNQELTVDEDRVTKDDINMFVDIPKKLLSELKKHHY